MEYALQKKKKKATNPPCSMGARGALGPGDTLSGTDTLAVATYSAPHFECPTLMLLANTF